MDEHELAPLLKEPEGQLLEFKREWYDFDTRHGKAIFARDVLAMANGLREGQVGRIIIGREDPDRGGEIVGVGQTPTVEQLIETLAWATRPVPPIRAFLQVEHAGRRLSVIEVLWNQFHPHYAMRQYDRVLSIDRVLVREGNTTRTLTPPELEMMIRAKDARIGHVATDGPLVVGFVELPGPGGVDAAVRVRNISEEPVDSISGSVDVGRVFPPGFVYRMGVFSRLTLQPDETREFTFQPSSAHYYYPDGTALKDDGKIWSRWFDLTLRVTYRGRDGIIQEVESKVSVGR